MRRNRSFLVLILLILIVSWTPIIHAEGIPIPSRLEELSAQVKIRFCPDRRTSVWEISVEGDSLGYMVRGETDSKVARTEFSRLLAESFPNDKIGIEIRLLPDDTMGANSFALPYNSVATLRRRPTVTEEIVNQTLRGLPLEILKEERGFFLARTDDGYLGWISDDRIVWGGDSLRNAWNSTRLVVFTDIEGVAYEKPSPKSQPVFDVVLGNRLKFAGKKRNWIQVETPDGRAGFLPSRQLIELNEYLARPLTAEAVLKTARKLVGRPYMWGAASPKFLDCSGFTQTVFRDNGLILQRDASMQVNQGSEVDTTNFPSKLKPGDLLFFSPRPDRITHVGIYIGDYQFIHSSSLVTIDSFNPKDKNYNDYRRKSLRRVKRIIPETEK